jgi:ABC-type branched-subunit amino acid transport system substrate-binding protein
MRNKSLRFVLLVTLLVMAAMPVYAQETEGQVIVPAGETIKIALVTDLSGPIAAMGLDIQQGAEIALMEFNEAGGVEGFEAEFIV